MVPLARWPMLLNFLGPQSRRLDGISNVWHLARWPLIGAALCPNREFKISQRGRGRERLKTIQFNYTV